METEEDIKTVEIDGKTYQAVRATDRQGHGYLEVRAVGGTPQLARATFTGRDKPLLFTTFGGEIDLPTLLWLLKTTEFALI